MRRVDRTFKAFFARVKKGAKPGFPRYKSSLHYDSITFPTYGNGCKILDNGKLRIHGAGHIKIKLHRPIEGTIKTSTIKRQAGRWFVCFSVEYTAFPLPPSAFNVGIDVGLKTFAVLSDGTGIENPRYRRNAAPKLRRCSRKVARRKKGSNRRRKAIRLLQRAYIHVANQRSDFHHKESRNLVNKYGLIAVEKLKMLNMSRSAKGTADDPGRNVRVKSGLNLSLFDAGWSEFIAMIAYKAECAGRRFVKVDARGTSQMCLCGARVPKTLADRWHYCTACGLSAPRDVVSAQLILERGRIAPSSVNVEVVVSCVA